VDGYLIFNIHFVEFIDATNTMIGKHQGSSLDTKFTSLWVLENTSCETSSTRCLATCVDAAGKERTNVLQELTLGCAWISNDADVDITSELDAFNCLFMDTSKELEENTLLDIKVAIY
jgi:hypothetical protein